MAQTICFRHLRRIILMQKCEESFGHTFEQLIGLDNCFEKEAHPSHIYHKKTPTIKISIFSVYQTTLY
jgi:hypothetical protein